MTSETAAKISAAKMGHAVSKETRRKIGDASRGRKQSPEQIEARTSKLRTHGMWRTPEYRAWDGMKQRCRDHVPGYGARGIRVCERWLTFENFYADMGPKPEPKCQYSIERLDGDGNYEPGNCVWADRSQQQHNRPGFDPRKAKPCKPECTCGKHHITLDCLD
jgi:hypothetical protein